MELSFDDQPRSEYDRVPGAVARWADQVFDWLEAVPVHPNVNRHLFTNGMRAVLAEIAGDGWVVLWEPIGNQAVVRYLGPDTFMPR